MVLGLGIDSGLSPNRIQRYGRAALPDALGGPSLSCLHGLASFAGGTFGICLIDPILLTWGQWGLAIILGYFQANLTIAYSFDRYSGSAIAISLKILLINAVGFSAVTCC